MKFVRKYSNNIIKKDSYSHRKENYDELEPEVFEEVYEIKIYTSSHIYKLDEWDVEQVIESNNYFTITYKQQNPHIHLKKIIMIKFAQVDKIEFLKSTLENDKDKKNKTDIIVKHI
jgi:hypothetical protein